MQVYKGKSSVARKGRINFSQKLRKIQAMHEQAISLLTQNRAPARNEGSCATQDHLFCMLVHLQ